MAVLFDVGGFLNNEDMSAEGSEWVLATHDSINAIGESEWTPLVVGMPPFLSFAWLRALETTGCVGAARGWLPFFVTLRQRGALVGAVAAYIKSNSEGEFVFDYSWAEFAASHGLRYYPKLVVAVPFTPATGPRLLVAPGADAALVGRYLVQALCTLTERLGLSGCHVLFPDTAALDQLESEGLLRRTGLQFQWRNADYRDFEQFLSRFSAKRRHQIRRERRELEIQGTSIETLAGAALTPEMVDLVHEFYAATVDKFFYGRRYLNHDFFEEVCSKLGNQVHFVLARDSASGRPLAGAFNLLGSDTLYGRYWGAREDRAFLHFNVCFYHSIEECIQRKLKVFEPGAGGEHKLARGFEPTATHSAHYLVHQELAGPVANFLQRERAAYVAELERYRADPVLKPL